MKFEFCYVCTTWCKLGFFCFCDVTKTLVSTSHVYFGNRSVGYFINMVLAQTRSSRVVFVEKGTKMALSRNLETSLLSCYDLHFILVAQVSVEINLFVVARTCRVSLMKVEFRQTDTNQ